MEKSASEFNVCGITFYHAKYSEFISRLRKGALMVVPAAPALATIDTDTKYYKSIAGADFAILDSGLLVLILKVVKFKRIRKYSGYLFIKEFLDDESVKFKNSIFLINSTNESSKINHIFLRKKGFNITVKNHYVAPFYDKSEITDVELLEKLNILKPKFILINLGGGVQERLGFFLKNNLSFTPGIICTGAALSFFTGQQTKIPMIVDKFYLGWLARCLNNPRVFIPRYLSAFKLVGLLLRNFKSIE